MIRGTMERLMSGTGRRRNGGILKLLADDYLAIGMDPDRYENFLMSGDPNTRAIDCEVVEQMELPLGVHD